MKRILLILTFALISITGFSQDYFEGIVGLKFLSTDTLDLKNVFVWQGDTIRKDSIAYIDNRIDSIRVKYINGAFSKWIVSSEKLRQLIYNHSSNTDNPHKTNKTQVGLGNVTNDVQVKRSEMGANNGVATLDAGGKVPTSQLPSSMMIYKGVWSPLTNNPTLSNGIGTSGWVYKANLSGSCDFGGGIISFYAGDWVIYNGSTWERSVGTDNVVSVNGQQGIVVLNTSHIPENTNLYYTDARARGAISLTTTGSSGAATYSSATGIFNIPTYTLEGLGGEPTLTKGNLTTDATGLQFDNTRQVIGGAAKLSLASGYGIPTTTQISQIHPQGTDIQAPTRVGDLIGLTQTTTTISIADKEPAFSKNTAFNKNFGTTAGTVLEGRTFGTAANNNTGDFLSSSINPYNTSMTFDEGNRILYLTDGGATRSVTISQGNIVNCYTNTFAVTSKDISVTWPTNFNDTNYDLEVRHWWMVDLGGKSVRMYGAMYDFTQTISGFSCKLDTLVGYITYRAVNSSNLYPITISNYLPLSGGAMNNTNLVTNMNADLLDGYHETSIVKKAGITNDSYSAVMTIDNNLINGTQLFYGTGDNKPNVNSHFIQMGLSSDYQAQIAIPAVYNDMYIRIKDNGTWYSWRKLWSDGNDGYGSGLDADLLNGYRPSSSQSNNTIVLRDAYGFIHGSFYNSNVSQENYTATNYIYDTGDGWFRKKPIANVKTELVTSDAVISGLGYTPINPLGLTSGYLPYWNGSTLVNSPIYTDGTNVGIGTTNPQARLDIQNINGYDLLFSGTAGTDIKHNVAGTEFHISTIGTGIFLGGTSDASDLNLLPSGNVGIGYSTGTEITNNKLAVNGNAYFNGAIKVSSIYFNDAYNNTRIQSSADHENIELKPSTSVSIHDLSSGNATISFNGRNGNATFSSLAGTGTRLVGAISDGKITALDASTAKTSIGLENVTNESKTTMFTSPTFTGTPVAPTPDSSDNSMRIATTAFVKANSGSGSSLVYGKATANFNKTNNTSMANVPGMSVNVTSGKTYLVEVTIFIYSYSSAGIQVGFGGTSTMSSGIHDFVLSTTYINSGVITDATAYMGSSFMSAGGYNGYLSMRINGVFTFSASGTLTLMFAQKSSNATACTILKDSIITIKELN